MTDIWVRKLRGPPGWGLRARARPALGPQPGLLGPGWGLRAQGGREREGPGRVQFFVQSWSWSFIRHRGLLAASVNSPGMLYPI